MSQSHAETPSLPADPRRNPSYPSRPHLKERASWQAKVAEWDARLATVRASLAKIPAGAHREAFEKMVAQMQGGLDQVSDCVRRLPQETGELYAEDIHRIHEAESALNRLLDRWNAQAPK